FVHNNNGSGSGGVTLYNVIAYISSEVAGATSIALAADPYGQSPVSNNTIQQALTIATPTIAPSIGNFSSPYSADVTNPPADAISLGNITAGYCVALWIQRTATNSTAVNNDGCTILISGDSPA